MPLNLLKKYHELLEIVHLNPQQRISSLRGIFDRDILNNQNFTFRGKPIRPTIQEGVPPMDTLFAHLTTKEDKDEKGNKIGSRSFEMDRSIRIHWIKHHIEELKDNNMHVFSFLDRDKKRRKDIIRTYIYDEDQEYVIILEPLRNSTDYYLLTAYYFNEPGGKKQIMKKLKKCLPQVY